MSNALRYDSLLVRELASELDRTLVGARIDAVLFDRERLMVAVLPAPARRDGTPTPSLQWQLHPGSGHLTHAPGVEVGGRVPVRRRSIVTSVTAPPDERLLVLELDAGDAPGGFARRIIIELMPNQWNAIAAGLDGRIVAVLREREAGGRVLRAGVAYVAPERSARAGAAVPPSQDEWRAALGPVPPGERLGALARWAAYASPLNAAWIVGRADVSDEPTALDEARARYVALVHGPSRRPALIRLDGRWQPYVMADGADTLAGAEPAGTLMEAFAAAAERAGAAPTDAAGADEALALIADRLEALDARRRRLREEQEGAASDAQRMRRQADLLLSQLHRIERGAAVAELDDFAGGTIRVDLDPSLGGAENAQRLYQAAGKRDRAAARIPGLLRSADAERHRLVAMEDRVREGAATPDDIARLRRRSRSRGPDADTPLPYRVYRSTGGLEIRVGRGARSNDELTFRHSGPHDIWLHARDAAGAHVILRWTRQDENPPARDIAEAAVLAALSSRARTSGTVPVDWTRRKYVRKPRKAPPGAVLPERVRTIFVEPDPAVRDRLRMEEDG
ncbi:MAG TPA: NFACT RNA binding domain-containing protein [Longimicrobiales bacterium]|nr:NFACT RNA binding domain-containing protein [Longimicrobiales bacterium]